MLQVGWERAPLLKMTASQEALGVMGQPQLNCLPPKQQVIRLEHQAALMGSKRLPSDTATPWAQLGILPKPGIKLSRGRRVVWGLSLQLFTPISPLAFNKAHFQHPIKL